MIPNPALRARTIALVGLMGVGKSTIGRKLAAALDLHARVGGRRRRGGLGGGRSGAEGARKQGAHGQEATNGYQVRHG